MFETIGLKTQIWNNNLKSFFFLAFYPLIITAVYGAVIVVIMFIFTADGHFFLIINNHRLDYSIFFKYWYAPYIAFLLYLGGLYLYNYNQLDIDNDETLVTRESHPQLFAEFEQLCISRGLNMPYLFIKQYSIVNSYTIGLSERTFGIVLTSSLIDKFTPAEVQAVLAHQLVHILTHDTRLIFLTSSVTKLFDKFSTLTKPENNDDDSGREKGDFIFYLIFKLGAIGSLLPQILISCKRIYIADAGAIELTKDPQSLISALNKIDTGEKWPRDNPALIYNGDDDESWSSTRPPVPRRIEAIIKANRLDETAAQNTQGQEF